jgi:hypothetical protein
MRAVAVAIWLVASNSLLSVWAIFHSQQKLHA